MLTYEQQIEKLANRKDALTKRISEDQVELDHINAKLSMMQLDKIRETIGADEKDFYEMLTKHPEKLQSLFNRGAIHSARKPDTNSDGNADANGYQKKYE